MGEKYGVALYQRVGQRWNFITTFICNSQYERERDEAALRILADYHHDLPQRPYRVAWIDPDRERVRCLYTHGHRAPGLDYAIEDCAEQRRAYAESSRHLARAM